MNIYAKLENVAIVVATFAPAAIISVEVDVTYATISTITIVNTVLNICSNVCALAVIFNVLLPLKYPLNTDDIDTKNIAGDNAINVSSASGIWIQLYAIVCAPKNNNIVPIAPIIPNVANATLNILLAPLLSPNANLSETNLDIAFGTPIDEIVSNNAYIWYPLIYIAFPASPNPSLFVKYNVYINPKTFIKIWENIIVITPCIKLSFFTFAFSSVILPS